MDSDQAKLFVGGISWETSEEKLKDYFGQYGDVLQVNIMRDKATGRPRGFGFVLFSDPSVVDGVLQDKHTIDGRPVEAKRAMSREDQQNSTRVGNNNGGRNVGAGGNMRTKKIFVGGLPPSLTEEYFRQYFENFGPVNDVVIMYDQNTQRPRGFGFVTFDSEDAVDRVLQKTFHDLNGKQVEVKRAFPKDANPGMTNRGGGDGAGGNYGYNSGGNQNYDSRMDSNRYMQPQNSGGAYPSYGSSGYGAGYGYGAANSGMGYGGYAAYGGGNQGYGGPAGTAYGNPNSAAPRSSWNAQTGSGYGAAGYGNAGAWAGAGAGAGSGGPTGQSPGGAAGYGNQGYGYGNYGGGDGSYGSHANYGNAGNRAGAGSNASGGGAGGDLQGSMGGYGSGYGDANGQGGYGSGNYGAPANGAMGYGGGYGGAQNRQG